MGLVYSAKMKEICQKIINDHIFDVPTTVPQSVVDMCYRIMNSGTGKKSSITYRKTRTQHRKNTTSKKNRRLRRSIRRIN